MQSRLQQNLKERFAGERILWSFTDILNFSRHVDRFLSYTDTKNFKDYIIAVVR